MTIFEKIPDLIRDSGLITWQVKSSEKSDNAIVFRSDDNVSVEANIERMRKLMSCYSGDYFVLIGYDKPNTTRGGVRFEFTNTRGSEPAVAAAAPTTISGHTDDEMQAMINLAVGKVEQKYQELELQRRAEELKEREHDYNTGLGLALTKLGAAWKHAHPQVGVAGIGASPIPAEAAQQTKVEQSTAGDSDRAAELINRWLDVDEEALDVLERIVQIAEEGEFRSTLITLPYDQLRSMLLE